MKTILRLLTSKTLWVFIGILSLCLLVWFIGPLISIGDLKPLLNKWVRIGICVFVFSIWLFRNIFKRYSISKKNSDLIDEIKAAQEPILKNVSNDSEMSKQFAEIDRVLKKAKFTNGNSFVSKFNSGQYLYQMPWYVILGVAGSGKTSALENSGLNFPLESSFGSSSISGLAGTRDCDWFLSDEAVLLDTAGRLSVQSDNNEQDKYDWQEFLSLLKKYRPKKPVNGAVVTIGLDDLLGETQNLKNITLELKKRVSEMSQYFETEFPVYLMITKLDRLEGFSEFFSNLDEKQKQLSFGFKINNDSLIQVGDSDIQVGYVAKQLEIIEDNINAATIKQISSIADVDKKNAAFMFAQEFQSLKERVILLFKELNKSSKFESAITWRGIYFTSAKQEGQKLDPLLDNIGKNFGLTKKYLNTTSENSKDSYFLKRLFTNIIFTEQDLASENNSFFSKRNILYTGGIATALFISTIIAAFLFNSYFKNKSYLNDVHTKTEKLSNEIKDKKNTKDLYQAINFANDVSKLSSYENQEKSQSLVSLSMGLDQTATMSGVTDASYQRILQDSVMPLISYKIDDIIRSEQSSLEIDKYNALKAYLMMFDKEKFDAEFIYEWLLKYLNRDNGINSEDIKLKDALKQILSQETFISSVPFDKNLVETKRREISTSDIASMILSDTFSKVLSEKDDIVPVSFESMGGIQTRLVFRRESNRPITEPIDYFYTKAVYKKLVLPNLIKSTSKIFSEEDWVLGKYAYIKSNEVNTFKEAQNLYYNQYINTWNAYLSDLKMLSPRSLRKARDFAQVLSDKNNSPLSNIIKSVSDQTTLGVNKEIEKKSGEVSKSVVQRIMNKTGLSRLNLDDDALKTLNSSLKSKPLVDKEFSKFHLLTNKSSGNDAIVEQVTTAINDLYKYLDVLYVAVDKGMELPSNESLFNYRAEINRLPNPFRPMFDQFSQFVLNKGLNEQTNRNNIAEAKRKAEEDKKERMKKQEVENQKKLEIEKKNKFESELVSNLDRQLVAAKSECNKLKFSGYPFIKASNKDVKLREFAKVFNSKSRYMAFQKLNPMVQKHFNVTTFNDFLSDSLVFQDKYSSVKKINAINDTFFTNNSENPYIGFELRFTYLDGQVDKLVLDYNKQKYTYNHGPVKSIQLSWPTKKSKQISLSLFKNNQKVANANYNGDWALYKLLEDGTIRFDSNNEISSTLDIDGKKIGVTLETFTQMNPFETNLLRGFNCP